MDLGGPVVAPHLYNGRNRTFFYMYYDGYRYTNTNNATVNSLLTPAMTNGNFSAAGIPPIYDPNSTALTSSGAYTRAPFPGNIIPTSELSPLATYLAKLVPAPNASGLSSNNLGSTRSTVRDDQGLIKIDQALHNGHFSVSYGDYAQLTTTAGPFGPVLDGSIGDNHGHRAIANWDETLSPTLLNHFNAAFTRWLLETLSGGQQTLTAGSNLNQPGRTGAGSRGWKRLGIDKRGGLIFSWLRGYHQRYCPSGLAAGRRPHVAPRHPPDSGWRQYGPYFHARSAIIRRAYLPGELYLCASGNRPSGRVELRFCGSQFYVGPS